MGLFDNIGSIFGLNDENKAIFKAGVDRSPILQFSRPFINGVGNIFGNVGPAFEKASAGAGEGLKNAGDAAGNVLKNSSKFLDKISSIDPNWIIYGGLFIGGVMVINLVRK
jgi:hypothetical protein